MWGQWFRVPEMTRLGIGRFIGELLAAIESREHKLLVYAGAWMGMEWWRLLPVPSSYCARLPARGAQAALPRQTAIWSAGSTVSITSMALHLPPTPLAGHDSTVVPILAALRIYNDQWPVYAANIVLEVRALRGRLACLPLHGVSACIHPKGPPPHTLL
jgi:hypothetical protein